MPSDDDPLNGDATDRRLYDSWHAFAKGQFKAVADVVDPEPDDDYDWHTGSPGHHVADMYVRRFGDATGRSSPGEFWWGFAVFLGVTLALAFSIPLHQAFKMAIIGWLLLGAVAVLSAAVRRLHDTGRSGARLLLWLLPFGPIYIIYVLSGAGDRRANDYGDPRVKLVGPLGVKMFRR